MVDTGINPAAAISALRRQLVKNLPLGNNVTAADRSGDDHAVLRRDCPDNTGTRYDRTGDMYFPGIFPERQIQKERQRQYRCGSDGHLHWNWPRQNN